MHKYILFILLLLLCIGNVSAATVNLSGHITNPLNQPVVARVQLNDTEYRITTNVTGYYEFNNIEAGLYSIQLQGIKYLTLIRETAVYSDTVANFSLIERRTGAQIPGFGWIMVCISISILYAIRMHFKDNIK